MEQKLRQLLNLVGLADEHDGIRGTKAGIILETALRGWTTSLGWVYDPDRQTLDKVVNWLREHGHITADEFARLKTDIRVRNHCAHGRWQLLEPGQVDHLLRNAEEWARKLSMRGIIGAPLVVHDADLIVEKRRSHLNPRSSVAWAFKDNELVLRSNRGLLLMLSLMMLPVLIFAVGVASAFGSIEYVAKIVQMITGSDGMIVMLPMMLTTIFAMMLPFGIAAVLFNLGLMRMSQASETSLAAASRVWVQRNPRKTVLEVSRKNGRRTLSLTELAAECPECSADMVFVPSSKDPKASVIAECVDFPANHTYKIDPSTMTGTRRAS